MRQIESLPVGASEIAAATRKDPILSKVPVCVKRGWPGRVQDALKPYWLRQKKLIVEQDTLLWGMRVIVPFMLRDRILQELHQGHQGITRMKSLARSHVWWPNIDSELEERAKRCSPCQEQKNAPPKAPLNPWLWPESPCDHIHIDFAGLLMGKMLLIATDAFSKWPEVTIMTNTSSSKSIAAFRKMFARNGISRELVSDNGPQFVSHEFQLFTRNSGIRHIRSSPYHPASDGAAERVVQTVKRALTAGEKDGLSMKPAKL